MLSAQHLVKSFAGRRVIENVTLALERGEVVGLLGPNGAGKTTTFQMLTGMLTPDAGHITLDGHNVTAMPFYDRARFGVAYLPQAPFVPRGLTVEENITLVLEARLAHASSRRTKLEELIEEFRLGGRKTGGRLSGSQRAAADRHHLACEPSSPCWTNPLPAWIPATRRNQPDDPPSGGARHRRLDHRHKARELLGIVDRAYVIDSGRVLAQGEVEEIVGHQDVRRVYLGEEFRL
jgi:lipopolysaccharide export system ATP-binding protein